MNNTDNSKILVLSMDKSSSNGSFRMNHKDSFDILSNFQEFESKSKTKLKFYYFKNSKGNTLKSNSLDFTTIQCIILHYMTNNDKFDNDVNEIFNFNKPVFESIDLFKDNCQIYGMQINENENLKDQDSSDSSSAFLIEKDNGSVDINLVNTVNKTNNKINNSSKNSFSKYLNTNDFSKPLNKKEKNSSPKYLNNIDFPQPLNKKNVISNNSPKHSNTMSFPEPLNKKNVISNNSPKHSNFLSFPEPLNKKNVISNNSSKYLNNNDFSQSLNKKNVMSFPEPLNKKNISSNNSSKHSNFLSFPEPLNKKNIY